LKRVFKGSKNSAVFELILEDDWKYISKSEEDSLSEYNKSLTGCFWDWRTYAPYGFDGRYEPPTAPYPTAGTIVKTSSGGAPKLTRCTLLETLLHTALYKHIEGWIHEITCLLSG
jgi:hypothetical protein